MRRPRYSEEQIVGILKQHQAGLGPTELCRKYGISDTTFYNWRLSYGEQPGGRQRPVKQGRRAATTPPPEPAREAGSLRNGPAPASAVSTALGRR